MSKSYRNQFNCLLTNFVALSLLALASVSTAAEPTDTVRKFDPRTRELIKIDPKEVVPGKIYNHYDQRQGRYVWAFATEGGEFSYPLGPGSTESPHNFDLVTSSVQTEQLLEAEIGDWANALRNVGGDILVSLKNDGKWEVLPIRSTRSHYDLNTGRRWEWHGKRRVVVGHTNGYSWRFDGEKYDPVNPWLSNAEPCGCCVHEL